MENRQGTADRVPVRRATIDGFVRRPIPGTQGQPLVRPLAAQPRPAVSSERRASLQALRAADNTTQQLLATKRFDMRLPGAAELLRQQPVIRRTRWWKLRTWTLRAALSVLVLTIGLGGWLFGQGYLRLHQTFKGGASAASLQQHVDPNLLKGEGDGRVNILLLGNGGNGHEAPDLTDTIMIASIDPVNHKVALVSVPRDLWIRLPGHGSMKLNAAYETGKYDYLGHIDSSNKNTKAIEAGFATADQAVEQILGIPIHYNMLVNFISFRQAVNTIGGITVNVPENLYDPTMAWENNWNSVLAKKGTRHFSGHQALLYARSRETSSDFARSERQRAVITAMKDKIVSAGTLSNPLKLAQLFSTFGNNVRTDLSINDAARVYELTKGISDKQVKSLGLGDNNTLVTTGRIGNQSVVEPTAGLYNYNDIKMYIRQQLPDGYIVKEHASIVILDGSGQSGRGKAEATELKSYGYRVTQVRTISPTTQTKLITNAHHKPYTKNYLQQRLHVKATGQSSRAVQNSTADFIIVLGNDETTGS